MAFSLSTFRKASAGLAAFAFLAGCGGGGDSGIDRPAPGYELGQIPVVKTLATPLGTTGSRGSGSAVFVSIVLVDREFNFVDAQIEYGFDGNNGGLADGVITGSDGDPSATDEYSPATPHPTSPVGFNQATNQPELHPWNLESARGKGADHVFIWDSAQDLPGRRFVTQDFAYLNDGWDGTPTGRLEKNSDGTDKILPSTGIRLRMRINDSGGAPERWGLWTATSAFELNNNSQPVVTIDGVGMSGVIANATNIAADEDVELQFHAYDDDTNTPPGYIDQTAVHVDFARKDQSFTVSSGQISDITNTINLPAHGLNDGDEIVLLSSTGNVPAGIQPEQTYFVKVVNANSFGFTDQYNKAQGIPAGLGEDVDIFNNGSGNHTFGVNFQWAAATTFAGVADTGLDTDTTSFGGVANFYKWDSVADVGTTNGDYILRITPFDDKSELGSTVIMDSWFRLDNFTIFTSADVSLSTPRVGHRMSTLPDGTVLITGGRESVGGVSVNKVAMFYPSIGQTTKGAMSTKTAMGSARAYHSLTRLLDDRLLAAGGFSGTSTALNSLEIYDPVTNTWAPAASMGTARARHTAVLLANGDVLLAGGVDSAGNALSTAEIYHADTDTVTAVPGGLNTARHSVQGVLLPDYSVMIPGGTGAGGASLSSVEVFDPAGNAGAGDFALGTAMPTARANHSVAISTNGKVAVTGGVGGAGTLNSVTVYDPQADLWTNGANMSSPRANHVGILMGDGQVLVAGGSSGAGTLATGQLYSPATSLYTALNGNMVTARSEAEAVILNNGRALIVGGVDGTGTAIAGIEIFTPDGGFNFVPSARVATPEEPQSYLFGAVIPIRVLDSEEDRARIVVLYSYFDTGTSQYTPWRSCTPSGGPYVDGVADTIADDYSDGVVNLESTDTDNNAPIDPSQDNTNGDDADHLFVWKIDSDIPVRQNYDLVKVRVIPYGAAAGTPATTFPFKIAQNTRVIPRIDPFVPNVSGTITVNYHLQDIDAPDPARIEFEFGVDLNGDNQILDDDGESWAFCTAAPGGDGLGNGYTLATSATFSPGMVGAGWHVFNWDSVHDIGSPNPADTDPTNDLFNDPAYTAAQGNRKVMLRITPYDFPVADPTETKGRLLSLNGADGLIIERDPNGLFLSQWATEGGTVYSGTTIGSVKIDEHIIFTFNRNVDPATVSDTTLLVRIGARKVYGTYETVGNTVTFYPLINSVNTALPGVLVYNGTENPTILTRGVTVNISIPGYTPGTNPEVANILRIAPAEWTTGDGTAAIAILHSMDYASAFQTILPPSLGAAAYFNRGIAPTVISATPALNDSGQTYTPPAQGFSFTFDYPISPDSAGVANLRFVVDINQDGDADTNDSVVPGTYTVVNTVGPAGQRGAVVTFTPLPGLTLPQFSRILASFAAVTAGDGTATKGILGGSPVTYFATSGSAVPNTALYSESFDNVLDADAVAANRPNRDAANTDALWNHPAFPGILTGNRDGGSGIDGTPTPQSIVGNLWTFSLKNDWNFSSFSIPVAQTWKFTGTASNLPVTIRSTTTVNIAGVLDVAGGDASGSSAWPAYTATTGISQSYIDRYPSIRTTGAVAFAGGTGIAGGGKGGSSLYMTTGQTGTAGTGGVALSAGQGAGIYASSYAVGGGGGGHAQNGQNGGTYQSGYYNSPQSLGGTSYGNANLTTVSAGSGGGAGSSYISQYQITDESYHGSGSFSTYYFTPTGGAAGGGGGYLKIAANGAVTLTGSGIIDASGGNGMYGYYYFSGAGGGGAGGSVHIISGGALTLNGMIDVRGGVGGECVYYRPYAFSSPTRYGCCGGDGASGRVRIEAPVIGSTSINFMGGANFNTIASSNGGALSAGSGALNAFPGSSTTTINMDGYTRDANGYYNFTTMNIPVGTTVTLIGTNPARMRFTGNVTINGTLRAVGYQGPTGVYGSSTAANLTAAATVLGSGVGGLPNASNTTTATPGQNGGGTGGGKGGLQGGYPAGWVSGSYTYKFGGSAGGGAVNRINFGNTPFSTWAGGNAGQCNVRVTKGDFMRLYTAYYAGNINGGDGGTGFYNPETATISGASFVGGSGGGGGGNGVYGPTNSTQYFYGAGGGGSGGGAIGIETVGSFAMGAAGQINVNGGVGGQPYTSVYCGTGGGGSGGTVIIRADTLSLSAASTIDVSGVRGGLGYGSYSNYFYGQDGGHGGPGIIRVESTGLPSVLNTGGILGYSLTTGSLSTAVYVGGGPTGTTKWRTGNAVAGSPDLVAAGAGLAPDFHITGIAVAPSGTWINRQGNVEIHLQGAMRDPITGARSATLTADRDILANPLSLGLGTPDPIDGYYNWRFVYKLNPATAGNPFPPEIKDLGMKVDTK